MMSDIYRLAAGISAHLAMEEACIEYSSDRRKHKKVVAIIQQVMSRLIASSKEQGSVESLQICLSCTFRKSNYFVISLLISRLAIRETY